MKIREEIEKFIIKFCHDEIERILVAERVRIWEGIFQYSSVRSLEDGNKISKIISIGEPKLEEIVLPSSEKFKSMSGLDHLIVSEHPSLKRIKKDEQNLLLG